MVKNSVRTLTSTVLLFLGTLSINAGLAFGQQEPILGLGIPNSSAGFDQQYQPLFSAWSQKDNRKLDNLLVDFAIPHNWFLQTFGPEEGEELAKLYSDQFDDFKRQTINRFGMAASLGTKYIQRKYGNAPATVFVGTTLKSEVQPNPVPRPPPESLQPLPPIQKFSSQGRVEVRDEKVSLNSWMDSFLYIDGGFRFAGHGAYPFWDAARVRLADPCAKPGEPTGGKLITKVEPEYPPQAKDQRIEGSVRARLTIATDGTVSNVDITEGPPLLVDAATKAFRQWRYTPFMNCGNPVEMRSMERLVFSLH